MTYLRARSNPRERIHYRSRVCTHADLEEVVTIQISAGWSVHRIDNHIDPITGTMCYAILFNKKKIPRRITCKEQSK